MEGGYRTETHNFIVLGYRVVEQQIENSIPERSVSFARTLGKGKPGLQRHDAHGAGVKDLRLIDERLLGDTR